ncbi:MAG: hypothetical protein R3D28_20220 [Geminicoccaceae bacterium]
MTLDEEAQASTRISGISRPLSRTASAPAQDGTWFSDELGLIGVALEAA